MNLNPLNARTLEDLEQMQRDAEALFQQQNQMMNIPYSNRRLTPAQYEISNEMSQYGSTLIPTLLACGAGSCLGVTAHLIKKHLKRQPEIHQPEIQQPNTIPNPEEREFTYNTIIVNGHPTIDLTGDEYYPLRKNLRADVRVKEEPN